MEQTVCVQAVFEDGTARVVYVRQSACTGDCHQCAGCGAAKEQLVLIARNPIGAKPGDLVKLQSSSSAVLQSAAMLYLVPLGMFFAGYCMGKLLWAQGGLTGCAGFAVGIVLTVLYDRLIVRKKKMEYMITGFAIAPES